MIKTIFNLILKLHNLNLSYTWFTEKIYGSERLAKKSKFFAKRNVLTPRRFSRDRKLALSIFCSRKVYFSFNEYYFSEQALKLLFR
jgi:hypothetical protein